MSSLKAVLFDLDDTLIDWSGFKADWAAVEHKHLSGVFNYLCANIHQLPDLDAYIAEVRSRMMGAWTSARMNLRAPNLGTILVEAAAALGAPAESLDARRCLESYAWEAVAGTVGFPDAAETLKLLAQHGVKVGIVTNAHQPMWLRDVELRTHGLFDFFPTCRISAADVGYLKPHPAIFQAALNCTGTNPSETVFVGDDPEADIVGAQAAGLLAVLRRSRRGTGNLSRIVPDEVIDSLAELPAILDGWYPGWRNGA
ncbi:MAG: HAD family hydrolase [Anaerolinea sp.]|nr:HAD family hydrolase [Anaerolinea sp.]